MPRIWKLKRPPFIDVEELVTLLDEKAGYAAWPYKRIRQWILRHGATTKEKVGLRHLTTCELLCERCPLLWEHLVDRLGEPHVETESPRWKFPPFIGTGELAAALNRRAGYDAWTSQMVLQFLAGNGAIAPESGAHRVTTRELLREHCPTLWNESMLLLKKPRVANGKAE